MTSQNCSPSDASSQKASDLAKEGELLLKELKCDEAMCRFDKALAAGLDAQTDKQLIAWIHARRGMAWMQLGIPRDAVLAFNLALAFNPDYTLALAYRGEALRCHVRDNLPALEKQGLHWAYIADILADFEAAKRTDVSTENSWLAAHHGAAWALAQFAAAHVPILVTEANIRETWEGRLHPIPVRSSFKDIWALERQARRAKDDFADNAARAFQRACELKKDYAWCYAFWGLSLTLRSTRENNYYDEATEKLELAQKYGMSLSVLATQGLFKLLSYKGRYEDSLHTATLALSLNAQDPFAPYYVATTLHHLAKEETRTDAEATWKRMAHDAVPVARKRLETMRLMVQLMEVGLDLIDPRLGGLGGVSVERLRTTLSSILSRRDPEAVCLLKNDPTLAQLHGEPWFKALWHEVHRSPEPAPEQAVS